MDVVTEVDGRSLVPGHTRGAVLHLRAPISFWGGVDPETGVVADPRHPDRGASLAGRVVIVPQTIGSSSSSAIILELMRRRRAPAGLVLGTVDAILTLGVLVGREMGYGSLPVVAVGAEDAARIPAVGTVAIVEGTVSWSV